MVNTFITVQLSKTKLILIAHIVEEPGSTRFNAEIIHCHHNYIYTVSQKTSPSFISCSLVKHCPISIIFCKNIYQIYCLEEVVSFSTSPHLCSYTTWVNKNVNLTHFVLYVTVSVLVLYKKLGYGIF